MAIIITHMEDGDRCKVSMGLVREQRRRDVPAVCRLLQMAENSVDEQSA